MNTVLFWLFNARQLPYILKIIVKDNMIIANWSSTGINLGKVDSPTCVFYDNVRMSYLQEAPLSVPVNNPEGIKVIKPVLWSTTSSSQVFCTCKSDPCELITKAGDFHLCQRIIWLRDRWHMWWWLVWSRWGSNWLTRRYMFNIRECTYASSGEDLMYL